MKQKLRFLLEDRFGEEAYMLERLLLEDFGEPKLFNAEKELSPSQIRLLETRTHRLFQDEPIQYILEKAHFYGRDFKVNPSVLIPRRETEELMYWVKKDWEKRRTKLPLRILDIGTGSACIPISLDLEFQTVGIETECWGMDVSAEALKVAKENAQLFNSSCQFSQGDVFEMDEKKMGKWDLIISNPPYVPKAEKSEIATRVKDHEPGLALFVPDSDPFRFYKKISELASNCLNPNGQLYFEIHEDYGAEMKQLLASKGFEEIVLKKDMQGKDRMIRGTR